MEREKQRILELYKKETLPHTLLLWGRIGAEAKTALVKNIAAQIFAQTNENNHERLISLVNREIHPDMNILRPDDRGTIKIAEITRLQESISKAPFQSPVRIILIERAEHMTVQAQNSLLKTIEEPPEKNILFLTTQSPNALLHTIKSRAVTLFLRKNYKNFDELFPEYSPFLRQLKTCIGEEKTNNFRKELQQRLFSSDTSSPDIKNIIRNIEKNAENDINKLRSLYEKSKEINTPENQQTKTVLREKDLQALLVRAYLSFVGHAIAGEYPAAAHDLTAHLENRQMFTTGALIHGAAEIMRFSS